MNFPNGKLWGQWLHAAIYAPEDDEEATLAKKVWNGIAGSSFILGAIAGIVYACLHLKLLVWLMAGFCGFFLASMLLFLHLRKYIEWFFLSSEVFKVLFSFVAVILSGGILYSGGFVFIGLAGIFFALAFPRPGQVRFLLLLYLGTVSLEAVLQPWLRPAVQFSAVQNLVLFVLYFFASVLSLYSFVRIYLRERVRFRQAEAEKLRALDAARSQFFTNISHEFRTPLMVILGMADQIQEAPSQQVTERAVLIRRNGGKLLRLVEQVLDLSRLEAGTLEAHYVQADVVAELKYLLESFHSLAEAKGISLHFSCQQEELWMDTDPEKLEHLLGNLLDNAIKYTPAGGAVQLAVSSRQLAVGPSTLPTANCLLLTVTDTGIGIPPEHLERIFDRYYRVGEWPTEGAGIGLAMAREYARLLDGHIEVDSRPGEGSTFSVFLPVRNNAPRRTHSLSSPAPDIGPKPTSKTTSEKTAPASRPRLLIIEDNPDVIRYLQLFLEESYDLITASDGEEGTNLAIARVPDIIISDIMMPKKDGLEVCRALKGDFRTNHIPLILLTAKTDVDSRVSGLEYGADAYLAKPFHRRELEVELRKLIQLRDTLKRKYGSSLSAPLPESKPIGLDERFLYEVRQCLEKHYQDEAFGIKALCAVMSVSRTQLHRKLAALTGRPASHFIRAFRLEKARQLLQTTRLAVNEAAYAAGFKDPYYFSRVFTREFGVSPSEAREGISGGIG